MVHQLERQGRAEKPTSVESPLHSQAGQECEPSPPSREGMCTISYSGYSLHSRAWIASTALRRGIRKGNITAAQRRAWEVGWHHAYTW